MEKKIFNGRNSVATSAPLYFDCGLNHSERHIVYDDLTPEKLSTWFKATKYKLPLGILGQSLTGFINKEDGEYSLVIYQGHCDGSETNKWNLRIGKTITKSRWNAIAKFVEDYVSGSLGENYRWNKEHRLALA